MFHLQQKSRRLVNLLNGLHGTVEPLRLQMKIQILLNFQDGILGRLPKKLMGFLLLLFLQRYTVKCYAF